MQVNNGNISHIRTAPIGEKKVESKKKQEQPKIVENQEQPKIVEIKKKRKLKP